jgi:ribose transport system substrate-binding protein
MNKTVLALAGAAVAAMLVSGAYAADKKELAIVVKGLDNPFFSAMGKGCADWNAAHADSEYTCTYNGPATAADEAGELQIVQDLINKGVAGIAISPSNAPAMANTLRQIAPKIPVITIDAPLDAADQKELAKTYFGTDNYAMGVAMGEWALKLMPKGGKVCLQQGNPAAANLLLRANGFRDTVTGEKDTKALTGQKGWTEVAGCPNITNDDTALANQQIADTMTANPDLNAYILTGGWAQFSPQAYTQNFGPLKDKIAAKTFVVIAGDTTDSQRAVFRDGLSNVQIGQRPYEMGNKAADILIKLIKGEAVDPIIYTGLDTCSQDDIGICATP